MADKERVLLVNPPPSLGWNYGYKYSYIQPLGVLSVGTLLDKKGCQVDIVDCAYDKNYFSRLESLVKKEKFLFAGLSVMTSQISRAIEISRLIKSMHPDMPVVWGGVHPTLFPSQVCGEGSVDIAVIGEGEFTALELLGTFISRQGLERVSGIAYKREGQIVINPERPQADINTIPFFNYDLMDVEEYIVKDRSDMGGRYLEGGSIRRSLPVLSGLGCPYGCKFCIESILKKKYRRRNVKELVAELKRLMLRYKVDDIGFVDDLFFADKKWLFEFLDLIESEHVRFVWGTNVRADYFRDDYLNLDLLKRMRKLGCYHLGLGAESGSEAILQKIDKRIEKTDVVNAMKLCKQADINLALSFMIALPGESSEDMRETVEFAYQLASLNPRNSHIIGPNIYRPYPGSALLEEAIREYDFKLPGSLEEWKDAYSHNEGYFRLEKLPWVKNPLQVRLYSFYLFRATTHFVYPGILANVFFRLLKCISQLRIKYGFYHLPVEYFMVETLRKLAAKKNT